MVSKVLVSLTELFRSQARAVEVIIIMAFFVDGDGWQR